MMRKYLSTLFTALLTAGLFSTATAREIIHTDDILTLEDSATGAKTKIEQDGLDFTVLLQSADGTHGVKFINSALANVLELLSNGRISGLQIQTSYGNSVFLGEGAGLNDDGTANQNVGVGFNSLATNTVGALNTVIGYQSLFSNLAGSQNTSVGWSTLSSNTSGAFNTATGVNSLRGNITGNYNTGYGWHSGRYIADGTTANETSSNSVYIGADTKALADGGTNENVFGYNATGHGSNTTTIGDSNITDTYIAGQLHLDNYSFPVADGTANQFLQTDGAGAISFETATASDISDFDTEVSNNTDVANNTTHITSTGADHTYIDQSVISGSTPTFGGINITGVDHGGNAGLLDDDHTQYALLAGRAGGQTLIGATGVGDDLTITSTSNATKGSVKIGTLAEFDEALATFGLGTAPVSTTKFTGKGLGNTSATNTFDFQNSDSVSVFKGGDDGVLSGLQLRSNFGNSVFLGEGAGLNDDGSDNRNVGVGIDALRSNTTGSLNTANGYQSLFSNTTGADNTANGLQSLRSNTTGADNTANGVNSLFSNTTGSFNTANGRDALRINTTGANNTANGVSSLFSNTIGTNNTANGLQSLRSNTTGADNTANGVNSLFSNTTGGFNTANGRGALYSNTTGTGNTANGVNSLFSNTTGANNTANGVSSGRYIADGTTTNATSSNSVYIGADTKALADGGTNENVIGNNATGHGSNTTTIGDSDITDTYIAGQLHLDNYSFPVADGGAGAFLQTDGAGAISFILPALGEIYQTDNTAETPAVAAVVDVWYEIENFTAGVVQGTTASASSLTINTGQGGIYSFNVAFSGVPANANNVFEFAISINDTILTKTKSKRNFSSTTDAGSVALNGLANLAAGDVVKVELRNITAGNKFTVQNCNVTIHRVD